MSKFYTLNVEGSLRPFEQALGKHFPKVVRDIKSLLGNVEKDIITKPGTWKASAKFKLTSKDGHSVQLPPNNPASILLCFGMRLEDIAAAGGFKINAEVPKDCLAWVEKHSTTPEVPAGTPTK